MTVSVFRPHNVIDLCCRVCGKKVDFTSEYEEPHEYSQEPQFPEGWSIVTSCVVFQRLNSKNPKPFALCPEHSEILVAKGRRQ
jgi:hypothetical protein